MPNPTIGELLQQGLIITVLGITLVFAGLGLLWGVMELLMRVLPHEAEAGEEEPGQAATPAAEPVVAEVALEPGAEGPLWVEGAVPDLTAERARVAAIVAGLLLAHALPGQPAVAPLVLPASANGANGHNGYDDAWMSTNRVRSLHSWQPPRVPKR